MVLEEFLHSIKQPIPCRNINVVAELATRLSPRWNRIMSLLFCHSTRAETNTWFVHIFARLHKYLNTTRVSGYTVNDISSIILAYFCN